VLDGDGTVKAFPGASGYGTSTPGGRGTITGGVSNTTIYRVTTLDGAGTGPGTIRHALSQTGPRIVVFTVAGIIDLGPTKLLMPTSSSYVTIAGQSAPGQGICLKNAGLDLDTHNVIIRGLRFRTGGHPDPDLLPAASDFQASCGGTGSYQCPAEPDTASGPNPGYDQNNRDNATIDEDANDNVVMDHCSFAWSTDEGLQIWRSGSQVMSNITVSYSTFMEPLKDAGHEDTSYADRHNHSFPLMIGNTQNISVHHNLFAHARKRIPLIDGNVTLEFMNNVIYNHVYAASHVDGASAGADKVAFMGNYYMKGLSSSSSSNYSIHFTAAANTGSVFYLENNYGFQRQLAADPEWNIATGAVPPVGDPMRAASRSAAFSPSDLVPDEAIVNKNTLLGQVAGKANRPGVFPLDPVDARAIRHAVSGLGTPFTKDTGVDQGTEMSINTVAQNVSDPNFVQAPGADNLGWHHYTGTTPTDADADGIPAYWETAYGLDDSNATDAKTVSGDGDGGYLKIEVYLNSLLPPVGE
jgi:pectate lyase